MVTVVRSPTVPAPARDPLTEELFFRAISSGLKRRQQEAAAQEVASAFSELISSEGSESLDPKLAQTFLSELIGAGGTAGQGISALSMAQEARTDRLREVRTQQAFAELGADLEQSGSERGQFVGSVLSREDLPSSTKIAIAQQAGTLFPDDKKKTRAVKLFDPQGQERTVNVPTDVTDPQKFLEENAPDVLAAGFSTTKPKLPKERAQTETERDVASIVRETPVIRDADISDKEKRDRARQILRNEDVVLRQLEGDFKKESEEGLAIFADPKDRIMFELSRQHIRSVMGEGITDPGKAVAEAKKRGEQSFNRLEFLPPELSNLLTPEGMTGPGATQNVVRIVQFLMDPELRIVDPLLPEEERFSKALEMLRNRVNISPENEELLKRELGLVEPQDKKEEGEDDEDSLLDRIFG